MRWVIRVDRVTPGYLMRKELQKEKIRSRGPTVGQRREHKDMKGV